MQIGTVKNLVILIISVVIFTACGQGGGCAGIFQDGKGNGVPVTVEEVRVEQSLPIVTVSGKLIPTDRADISYPNDVKVQEVTVSVGSYVNAGDALFRLAEDDMNNQLRLDRARKVELDALVEKNNNLLRDRQKLQEEGKIDQEELSRLEREIAVNEAELERVKAEIVKLTYDLEHVVVTSPISGVVTKVDISSGATAEAGTNLISILNVNPIIVSFPLNAKQAEDVGETAEITVFVNELPEKSFKANVTYVSPELQRTGTFNVWAAIPNDNKILKVGMNATTEFKSDSIKYTYIIPAAAVISQGSEPYVYKVSKGVVHRTPVVIGALTDAQAEVVRGLSAGDIVVVKGAKALFDGADVRIWR